MQVFRCSYDHEFSERTKREKVNKFLLTNALKNLETQEPIEIMQQGEVDNEEFEIKGVSEELNGSYTKKSLEDLKGKQLKEICKTFSIPQTGKKNKLAERIHKHLTRPEVNDEEIKLLDQIKEAQQTEKSFLHKLYGREFNAEDVFDIYLYKHLPKWRMNSWRSKVLITLVISQILNAWSIRCEKLKNDDKNFKTFISEVAGHWISKLQ